MPTLIARKKREEKKKKDEELKRRNTSFIVPTESPREKYRREAFAKRENRPAPKEGIAPYKRKNKATLEKIDILTCHNTAVHIEDKQWVNLEKDEKNIDNIRNDIERLGKDVKLRVKIDLPNTEHTFVIEHKKRIADKSDKPYEVVSKQKFTEISNEKGYIFITNKFKLDDEINYQHIFKASSDIEHKLSATLITKNDGLTVFLGGAGMRGNYQYDMIKSLKEAGVSNVVRGNYSAFFTGKDEELLEEIDIFSDSGAVIFYNQDKNDPIALQFVDTRGCEVGTETEFLNMKYSSFKGKTIKNEDCPNAFYYELEASSDLHFDLKTIQVINKIPKVGQFNFIGYSWGSVIAARTALEYASKGIKVDNLVLIGSPINYSLLQAVQKHKNIKNVIILNLTEFGDPIYAGMTDTEILASVLQLKEQMNKSNGHFYYSSETKEGKERRTQLAKKLFKKGLK